MGGRQVCELIFDLQRGTRASTANKVLRSYMRRTPHPVSHSHIIILRRYDDESPTSWLASRSICIASGQWITNGSSVKRTGLDGYCCRTTASSVAYLLSSPLNMCRKRSCRTGVNRIGPPAKVHRVHRETEPEEESEERKRESLSEGDLDEYRHSLC